MVGVFSPRLESSLRQNWMRLKLRVSPYTARCVIAWMWIPLIWRYCRIRLFILLLYWTWFSILPSSFLVLCRYSPEYEKNGDWPPVSYTTELYLVLVPTLQYYSVRRTLYAVSNAGWCKLKGWESRKDKVKKNEKQWTMVQGVVRSQLCMGKAHHISEKGYIIVLGLFAFLISSPSHSLDSWLSGVFYGVTICLFNMNSRDSFSRSCSILRAGVGLRCWNEAGFWSFSNDDLEIYILGYDGISIRTDSTAFLLGMWSQMVAPIRERIYYIERKIHMVIDGVQRRQQ